MTSEIDAWRVFPAAEFPRRARAWDAVATAGGYPPFLQSDFLAPCLREFGTGSEVIAMRGGDDAPSAFALLAGKMTGVWETFQPSQLPLGAFVAVGIPPLDDVLGRLLTALPGPSAMVSITQQDPSMMPRPVESPLLETLDYVQTARIAIGGSFDAYWASRGKNLRHNVKRQLAKIEESGKRFRVDAVDTPSGAVGAVEEYGRLESAGWKAGGGTAIAPDNAQGRFFTSVLGAFCETGGGRIYRAFLDDTVVAMDLCIQRDRMLVVLKTTYDETLKSISPASLLRHAYFREVFESKSVAALEFYGRVMEWHLRWTDDVRMLYHVNRYRTPLFRSAHRLLRGKSAQGQPTPVE